MTSDSCRKVKEGNEVNVDHKEPFRKKIGNQILTDNEIKPSVITPHHSEMIRVCTRSRDYSSRQNETFHKDNHEKEIDTDNLRGLQLQDDIINIILRWKEGEMRPAWSDISHMSPELNFSWYGLQIRFLNYS